jgi:hypothetical protein
MSFGEDVQQATPNLCHLAKMYNRILGASDTRTSRLVAYYMHRKFYCSRSYSARVMNYICVQSHYVMLPCISVNQQLKSDIIYFKDEFCS